MVGGAQLSGLFVLVLLQNIGTLRPIQFVPNDLTILTRNHRVRISVVLVDRSVNLVDEAALQEHLFVPHEASQQGVERLGLILRPPRVGGVRRRRFNHLGVDPIGVIPQHGVDQRQRSEQVFVRPDNLHRVT